MLRVSEKCVKVVIDELVNSKGSLKGKTTETENKTTEELCMKVQATNMMTGSRLIRGEITLKNAIFFSQNKRKSV